MQRNEARARSGRRPLRVLSDAHDNRGNSAGVMNDGGKWSSKPQSGKKLFPSSDKNREGKSSVGRAEEEADVDILDRLLLVQSDLSNFTRQIDEIVVQAFKVKDIGKQGKKEVRCFASFFSETLSSLKQWALRLQAAIADSPEESERLTELSSVEKNSGAGDVDGDDDDENMFVSNLDETKLDSLISPSPLVFWPANPTVERSRQVFLLTPLPMSKALSSKFQESSKPALGKMASATASMPSLLAFSGKTNDEPLKDGADSTSNQPFGETGFVSPLTLPREDYSVLMMTPCFKVSPPKSCAFLQPVSESVYSKNCNSHKPTPFPIGLSSKLKEELSESSGSEASDDLATKYPELMGIRRAQKLGLGKKERESSPDWFFPPPPPPPPKSCILMEPPDVKHLNVAANTEPLTNQQAGTFLSEVKCVQDSSQRTQKQEPYDRGLALIESTPVWRDPQSAYVKGKRPGETTLKKELWTKFEAASSFGFQPKGYDGLDLEKKGFLDRLDEVS